MKDMLPVGAVVLLDGAEVPLMIVGYMVKGIDEKEREYMGVPYPIGYTSLDSIRGFNHSDIKEVLFEGYKENIVFNGFMNKLNKNK